MIVARDYNQPSLAVASPEVYKLSFGFYPGEKAVLERMKALRGEGPGFDRLAAQMNAEGLRRRKGTPWDGKSMNRILTRLGV